SFTPYGIEQIYPNSGPITAETNIIIQGKGFELDEQDENAAASWQQQQLLEQLQTQLQKQQQQNQAEIEELRTTVIGVGQRVLSLESMLRESRQQLEQVAEQQQSIQLFDPE
ncbi:MAG: hypothetical protein ACKO96_24215, partial [Flammeovirgaceae bacterium]